MKVLLISNYYYPETVGAGIWVRQLALDLAERGHRVTVLTSFPSYPEGRIFPAYRGRRHLRETIEGIDVIRTFTLATPSKRFWPRAAAFGAFCLSALLGGLAERVRADVVYAVLPPLPLGVSAWALARAAGARLVVNVQDLYPEIAVATGFLRNRAAIGFFERMEGWIYRWADHLVVISEGFRQNLLGKGVPAAKISVVPNWADPEAIVPGSRRNGFRRQLGLEGEFVVLYAGGLTVNSNLGPVLEAARQLDPKRFAFVFVGDGAEKERLVRRARRLGLRNVIFAPFQPLERYAEVLAAADVTLVTLNPAATHASLPSKVYKQMAAARPILAVGEPGSELDRLLRSARCGALAPPDDPGALAWFLLWAASHPDELARMGENGRSYVETECSRSVCVQALEGALRRSLAEAA